MRRTILLMAMLLVIPAMVTTSPTAFVNAQQASPTTTASPASIVFAHPVDGYVFPEGDEIVINATVLSLSPAAMNASIAAYSNGQMVWSDEVLILPGLQNVTASFAASYGMSSIVLTGICEGYIISPFVLYIEVKPGVVLVHTGSDPSSPKQEEAVVLFFEVSNTLPVHIDNATLVLYRFNPLSRDMGFSDEEARKEIGRIEGIRVDAGTVGNFSITWSEPDWGANILIAVLTSDSNGIPYTIIENFDFWVEDLEESPLPALASFLGIVLYFPLAVFLFALIFSRKTKNGQGALEPKEEKEKEVSRESGER